MLQLQQSSTDSVFRHRPPPLWYLTNGDNTVGPVNTTQLVRGVERGRVPETCYVRAFRGHWRYLHGVREISALKGTASLEPSPEQVAQWCGSVDRLRDDDELAHTASWLAMAATGAESAMFHYCGRHEYALVTRAVLGTVSNARLGYPLSEYDLVVRAARHGIPVQGPPYGPVEDELAKRFASSQWGVGAAAMIPFFVDGKLTSMVELSRPGHAFRTADLRRAERIVQRALRARWR
jgi:hypothetical protein